MISNIEVVFNGLQVIFCVRRYHNKWRYTYLNVNGERVFTDIAHTQKSGDIQQNIWRAEKNILTAILMSDVEQKKTKKQIK